MSSHIAKRRASLIALVTVSTSLASTGALTGIVAGSLVSCGHNENAPPSTTNTTGTTGSTTDTVDIATATADDSAATRYKPLATTTATIRPRPSAAPMYLTTPPSGSRCYNRPDDATCPALGDRSLEAQFGATTARRLDDGPVLIQASPTASVQCCYHSSAPQSMKGRPLIVASVARIPSLRSRDDWSAIEGRIGA